MDASNAIELTRQALVTAVVLGAPVLGIALVVSLVVGLIQAMTQVQDQTVTFVPKMLAIALVVAACLPWALEYLVDYSHQLIRNIPQVLLVGG